MIARRHLILALPFCGCNRSRQKVIAVIPKATSHLFFVSVHAGVEQAARDLKVNVLWNGPPMKPTTLVRSRLSIL